MIFGFEARITFHLFLFFTADLLLQSRTTYFYLAFKLLQEPLIAKSLLAIKPLLYASLAYYLLKALSGADIDTLN